MLEIKEGASLQWQAPSFEGPIPAVRESHTAITWGTKLVVYGGMNGKRLGDLWILDTDPWKWTNVGCQGKVPLPRSLHVSSIIKNRLATLSLFLLLSISFLFSRSLSLSLVSFLFYPLSLSLSFPIGCIQLVVGSQLLVMMVNNRFMRLNGSAPTHWLALILVCKYAPLV